MLLRIQGELPKGRLEWTCECGHWNLEYPQYNSFEQQKFFCKGCKKKMMIVWRQITHWHLLSIDVPQGKE